MTERFRNPVIKYTTDTLKTLPGSILYFYQNGTSTPKTVYADKNKVTSLGATVTADSAGIFVPIFLDGTYRVTLKNAAGVTQTGWPVDNVGGEDTTGQFDDWSSITVYTEGDIVTGSNGLRYVAIFNASQNLNQDPTTATTFWDELRLTLEWDSLSNFSINDRVFYSGGEYISLQNANTGNTPASSSAWWKKLKDHDQWNSATTYGSGAYVYEGDLRYKSMQAANTNHTPSTDTAFTWWKPESRVYVEAVPQLIKIKYLSGGGALSAEWENALTDASTYTLPLANSVPVDTVILISKADVARNLTPAFDCSGADTILWLSGTATGINIDVLWGDCIRLSSNGTNQWRS